MKLTSILLSLFAVSAKPADEIVTSLPQMGTFDYGVYSGYVPITGTSKTIFSNLKSPHGGRFFGGKYMVTNTAVGDLQFIENNKLIKYNFENLPGKDEQVANLEWLQNSICLKDDCWITIDSNRTAFVVFDIKKQLKQLIPYDNNWAVQDLVKL